MKGLLRCLAFVLMVGGASAQSNLSEIQSNLQPCQGVDVSRWSYCFGASTYADGAKFTGEFKDGQPIFGAKTISGGVDSYVGEFKELKFNGKGTYQWGDGSKYVGEWKDGLQHGQGTKTLTNGTTYAGEYKYGKPTLGTMEYASGDKYIGTFKDGGFGIGTSIYSNGDKYIGEFRGSKYSGQGSYTRADGRVSLGEWKDGKPSGQHIEYRADKSIQRVGIFEDGKLIREENINPSVFASILSNINSQIANVQQSMQSDSISQPVRTNSLSNISPRNTLPTCFGKNLGVWTNCFGEAEFGGGGVYIGEWLNGFPNGVGRRTRNGVSSYGVWTHGYLDRAMPANEVESWINTTISSNNLNGSGSYSLISQPSEFERLRAEAEEAKKKQAELQEQLRIAQQQTSQPNQSLPQQSANKRIALVVGNANYKVRPLKNPRNDADDISRSLRSSGFDVIDLRDASLQQMRNGVRQFGDRLINNDVGLVYYSGHGVEVKGRNYFIPVNADIMREDEIADQGLDVSLILEKMNTAGKGVNILIVDACRDDPFGRSFRSSSRGLAQMDAPRGTIIAYATSPGKVASDGDGRNSPYTKNLVKAMQQPNKPIEQVFKEVRRAVQEETKNLQTPWENTSLSGDFYFKVQR